MENLKALIYGRELTTYQKGLAIQEFEKLLKNQKEIPIEEIPKIIRNGYICAMDGTELWINTDTDESIKFVIKDHDLRWKFYCKEVKITLEITKPE